jgi:hypothetical protein
MRIFIAVLFLALPLFAQDTEKKEPAALVKAREDYQRDILPITKKYVAKLEALKKDLGGRGDLDGATAVQAEIDTVKPDDDGSKNGALFGVWIGKYGTYEFRAGSRAWYTNNDGKKIEGKWTLKEKKFIATWTNGVTDTYNYPPQGDALSGVCSSGTALTLRKK